MSRIKDKIDDLNSKIADLESDKEHLEHKIRKANFRKDRKSYRKRLQDPMARATMKLMENLENDLYGVGK